MLKLRSTERLPYVCTFDPAVDLDKSNVEEYKRTLDSKFLVLKEGHAPSIFHLKRLTRAQKQHADKQASVFEMAQEYVAYGLERAENFDADLKTKAATYGDRLTKESLERICGCDELIGELAGAIRGLGGLDPLSG